MIAQVIPKLSYTSTSATTHSGDVVFAFGIKRLYYEL